MFGKIEAEPTVVEQASGPFPLITFQEAMVATLRTRDLISAELDSVIYLQDIFDHLDNSRY